MCCRLPGSAAPGLNTCLTRLARGGAWSRPQRGGGACSCTANPALRPRPMLCPLIWAARILGATWRQVGVRVRGGGAGRQPCDKDQWQRQRERHVLGVRGGAVWVLAGVRGLGWAVLVGGTARGGLICGPAPPRPGAPTVCHKSFPPVRGPRHRAAPCRPSWWRVPSLAPTPVRAPGVLGKMGPPRRPATARSGPTQT